MRVELEGQKWYEWIIPWHFHYGSEDENHLGICWLIWTFYFD